MKKLYEELTLEIIRFGAVDIITASDAAEDDDKDDAATPETPAKDDPTTGDDDGSQNGGEEISANYNDEPGSHVLTPSGTITIGDTAYPTYTDETGTTWIKGSDGNYYTQAYYEANT